MLVYEKIYHSKSNSLSAKGVQAKMSGQRLIRADEETIRAGQNF